jgi:psp operon transcriptional activator
MSPTFRAFRQGAAIPTYIPPEVPAPIGEAPVFREALARLSLLAPLDRPVLVVGERGTGKELFAARLNYLSPRWDRPFVKLNCAALAESLLDSELFGHEAGAFTGATRHRIGRFEQADRGTLFLDEIANASLAVQEKILRVIEYGAFERVGGNAIHTVDVRVIAATNADLPDLAAAGRFRPDLLDRLAFDVVTIPPLRERGEDIPLLSEHFARRMTRELGREFFAGFTARALARLSAHSWPGNVRELKNVVERSVYRMAEPEKPLDDVILDPFAAPGRCLAPAPPSMNGGNFLSSVHDYERKLLEDALRANRFNQRKAAEALGLGYHQLRRYLKKHGLLARPDDQPAPDRGPGQG